MHVDVVIVVEGVIKGRSGFGFLSGFGIGKEGLNDVVRRILILEESEL